MAKGESVPIRFSLAELEDIERIRKKVGATTTLVVSRSEIVRMLVRMGIDAHDKRKRG